MHPDPVRNALESEAAAIRLTGRGLNTRWVRESESESESVRVSVWAWVRVREWERVREWVSEWVRERERERERERVRVRVRDTPALYTPLNESSTKQLRCTIRWAWKAWLVHSTLSYKECITCITAKLIFSFTSEREYDSTGNYLPSNACRYTHG